MVTLGRTDQRSVWSGEAEQLVYGPRRGPLTAGMNGPIQGPNDMLCPIKM